MLTLVNAFSIFISNRDVMYLSDIKSYVSIRAACVSVQVECVSVQVEIYLSGCIRAPTASPQFVLCVTLTASPEFT